jgi:hypothetical protein
MVHIPAFNDAKFISIQAGAVDGVFFADLDKFAKA